MSNSTTLLDTIATNQSNKEAVANALFDAASPGMLWGRHASACTGLTWGFYGGQYGSNAIANGTVTLTASTTNYVYADNVTGAVSVNTTGVPSGKIPLYTIVTGTTTATSYTDIRSYAPQSQAGASFGNQTANYVFAGPISGSAAAPTFRALVAADLPVMGASGSSHAAGAVPDPGATAGSTRFLREDGTWNVPAGGGGSSTLAGLTDVSISSPTNGQVLTYNSSTSKWDNASAGGGGGIANDYINYAAANNPAASSFTLVQGAHTGGLATLTTLASGRGCALYVPQNTGNNYCAGEATMNVPTGTNWSIVTLLSFTTGLTADSSIGIFIADASGKRVAFGFDNLNQSAGAAGSSYGWWSAIESNTGGTRLLGVSAAGAPVWYKVTYDGTNFTFYMSADGESWVRRYQISATAYIGTPATCGIRNSVLNSSSADSNSDAIVTIFHYHQG